MQVIDYLQHEYTRIPSLAVSPSCSPVCPQEELPVGTRHPHWLRLQSKTKEIVYQFVLNTDCPKTHHLQWRFIPAMRPITPDVLMMSPTCMFSVAMIHLFRLPPATSAMSADLWVDQLFVHNLHRACCSKSCVVKADLTCTGRIALRRPSLQRAGPLCPFHSTVAESLSSGIFVYGRRRCHVSESFLCGRKTDEQLFVSVVMRANTSKVDELGGKLFLGDSHKMIKQVFDVFFTKFIINYSAK